MGIARIIVISGPSGVGKGTLIRGLLLSEPNLKVAISATTRKPRQNERDGVDYYFLSDPEFDQQTQKPAPQKLPSPITKL